MRMLAILAAIAVAATGASADTGVVNLDSPAALEHLRTSNPAHFKKVSEILARIHDQPPGSVPKWLEARFDARDIDYSAMLLVSYPPKRNLSFQLDQVRYKALLSVPDSQPAFIPAK